jgi:ribonuclease P protein component
MVNYSLKKNERLCNKKLFDNIFEKGRTIYIYPIKAIYTIHDTSEYLSSLVAFGTNKRTYKKAVNRNKIKRLLKEAYRKNKPYFKHLNKDHSVHIMFLYIAKEILPYIKVEASIVKILNDISSHNQ